MSCSGPLSTQSLPVLVPAELGQHHRVDAARAFYPLFKVLHARPGLEIGGEVAAPVAKRIEAGTQLTLELAVDREPLLLWRRAEVELVEVEQALELPDRLGVVVDPQVDEDVGPTVPATLPDDAEGRRLLPAAVTAGGLAGGKRGEETLREREGRICLERLRERAERLAGHQHVALRRVARTAPIARPIDAPRARVRGRPALPVDDRNLPLFPAVVVRDQALERLGRGRPFGEEAQPIRPVRRLDPGLSRDSADLRLGPGRERTDREKARRHGHAPFASLEIAGGDRERRGWHGGGAYPLPARRHAGARAQRFGSPSNLRACSTVAGARSSIGASFIAFVTNSAFDCARRSITTRRLSSSPTRMCPPSISAAAARWNCP